MLYHQYCISRDLAWQILLDQKITTLPVSVSKICREMGISVKFYESKDENSGFSTVIQGKPIIFVKADEPAPRQRFTAAHELGHILLGHVGKFELVNREPRVQDNPIEQEANIFASRLLAPACVLWGCGVKNWQQIAELCNISNQAAEFRFERLQKLRKRRSFLISPAEQKVFQNFGSFIQLHKISWQEVKDPLHPAADPSFFSTNPSGHQ